MTDDKIAVAVREFKLICPECNQIVDATIGKVCNECDVYCPCGNTFHVVFTPLNDHPLMSKAEIQ